MAIRVTCPTCLTRFNVSEKFAGKSGPCPKCKKTIKIPDASQEVKVFEPESFGPKGVSGQAILKPVFRKETSITPVQITLIASVIVGYFVMALVIRLLVEDKTGFADWLEFGLSLIFAFPVTFAGYTFLRNSELEPLRGQDLWIRIGAVSVIYGLLWLAMPLAAFTFAEYGTASWASASVVMVLVGAAVAIMVLELDAINGIVHYGFFFVACLLWRWMSGLGVFPGMLDLPQSEPLVVWGHVVPQLVLLTNSLG
ncbi:MAG TPA: hypothetical protein PKD64_00905 [Pirellulaceae bacterium]|nr:hypothetical protein [Pirellulaceae bacterium]HMO90729.1 hypothetical protein [Pirellulaceae bacterium]HMP67980.1 hypothetical protein [Pirellulaceae bacterium]